MKKEAAKRTKKQGGIPAEMSMMLGQLVLPMMLASEAIKKGLLAFVQQIGLLAFRELLEGEAAQIAGPKGKHNASRMHHHWGTAETVLPFGGRHVVVQRPRVRSKGKGGQEVELPSVAAAREADPMPSHVAEQIVVGVSTRGYERSLEPVDESLETRGESKSNVSRSLIEDTTEKLADFLSRSLSDLDIVAMFIDGIEIGKHAVIIALGVIADGTKVPLGAWCGSTENHTVATALLQNLIERGLRVEGPLLFVIDGGKGLRKALLDVFGDRAVVQRCQVHKARNIVERLPKSLQAGVRKVLRQAWELSDAAKAERGCHDGGGKRLPAAESLQASASPAGRPHGSSAQAHHEQQY